jgi:TP901 family phage tail tape measure protein
MTARTVEIVFLGNTKDLEASEERAALGAKGTGDAIADSFNSGTTRAGNALEKLGKKGENLGIPFASGLTTAGKHLDEATTKTGKLTSVLGELGKATVLAGGAMAAGIGIEAVKMGLQYESAQAKIQGATGQSTKAVKELTSAFGGTAGKFESSGEEMESAYAGVAGQLQATQGHALATGAALMFMKQATELNTAVQGNLAETTSSLSAVMQAFHLGAGRAAEASDTLFNVSTRLDVPIGSLATAMDKLHARLGTLSPTLSDMGGLMVSLGEHGVSGSRGVQTVSSAMGTLVGGSEKTTEVLKDLGVNIFNAQGKFIGMKGVIEQLGPQLDKLSQKEQVFAEKTLFGASAYQVMGSVLKSGVGAYQRATDAATKVGSAQEAAAKQAKTLHGEFETAKAAVDTLGGDLGLILLPELKDTAKGLAEGITWLTKHKEAALALGVVIGGPLAAAVTVYATQKAMSFVKSTGEMAQSMYKFGAKVVEVVPQVIAKLTMQTSAVEAAAATEESIYGDVDAVIAESTAQRVAAAKTVEASLYGEVSAADRAAIEIEAANTTMEGADASLVTANEAVGASFTAWLGPIGLATAALYGIVKAEEAVMGGHISELLGGNQPGEKGKEGEKTYKAAFERSNTPLQGNSVEQQIVKFFEAKGFSKVAAAGIAGNAAQESSFNPNAPGGGLFQDIGGRGAKQGASTKEQLEAAYNELRTGYHGVFEEIQHAKTPQEAANLFAGHAERGKSGFENPNEAEANYGHREQAALEAYERSGGNLKSERAAKVEREGAAKVEAEEAAQASQGGGSNKGIAGLMNETSNAKATKEAESEVKRRREKGESKLESDNESAAKAAAKYREAVEAASKAFGPLVPAVAGQIKALQEQQPKSVAGYQRLELLYQQASSELKLMTAAGTKGEAALKKYETNTQSSTPAAIEKSLGISTTGKHKSVPSMVEQAATTGKSGPLEKELGKSAGASEAGKQESKLVSELKATHQKALEEIASKLVAAHRAALATLAAEMVSTEQTKLGEQLKVQATEEKDRTTQAEHSAADQLNIVKAEQAQQTDAMKAAATMIGDATQSMSDSFSALTQSIEDQSKVMAAASNEVVQGIKDQTNIEVSILGERGLYGLNLIAQKEEVQLDEMKASYDQQIAQAQREEAQLTANWQQVTALDEQNVDQDKAMADSQEASAQAHLDSVTALSDQRIAAAQAQVDAAQLHADQLIGNADLKVLAATNAGKKKEEEAASGLKKAEGEGASLVAGKEAALKGGVEPAANAAISAASNELTRTTESWSNAIKQAEQNLAKAKGESAEQLAKAQQNLQGIEDKAAEAEAAKEKEVAVTKEKATTQYAGSGLVVNQYGMNPEDATANAAELGWVLRSLIPV